MNWALMPGALLLAMSVSLSGNARAAGEQHDHQDISSPLPPASAPATQPNERPSMPALGSAEDMLKALESMPPHDHDACCKLSKTPPTTTEHNH